MALEFFFFFTLAKLNINSCQNGRIRSYLGMKNVFTENQKCYFCTISLRLLYKYHLLVLSF